VAEFQEVGFSHHANSQLERPTSFGSELEDGGLVARIGTRPLPFPLEAVKGLGNGSLGQILRSERFKTWVVPHSFSVIRRTGLREPTSASLQVQYLVEPGQTCSVQGLLPQPQYFQAGKVGFSVALNVSGALVPFPEPVPAAQTIGGGLSLGVSGSGAANIVLSASVTVPVISAVGVGSDQCEWAFGELGTSLLGKDTQCWSIVVLPRLVDRLSLKLRLRLTHRVAFFTSRMDSDWVEVISDLPQE
jgi:hypothetical protein